MSKQLINLSNYYLGFIQLNPLLYNRVNATRLLNDVNYDWFSETDILTGFIQGLVVLLRKEDNKFVDELSSRYKNEIKYELGKTDKYGVKLSYVKPLTEVYQNDPKVYIKEDLDENPELYEEMLEYDYVIQYSKLNKIGAPVILNETLMSTVREEYYDLYFRNEPSKEKKL